MKNVFDRTAGLNFIETKKGIYVGGSINNAISRISPDNSIDIVLATDGESQSIQQVCWAKSAQIGHKILFSPCYGGTFILYDEENDLSKKIEVRLDKERENPQGWFWEVTTYGRFFYALGLYYPGTIRIDSENGEIVFLRDWVEGFYNEEELSSDEAKYYFLDGCVRYGDEFYFSTARHSSILKVDMLKDTQELIELDCGVEMIWSISADGDDIWMCDSSQGKVAVWNRITGRIKSLDIPSSGYWYAPAFYGDWAYFLPVTNEAKAWRIHKKSFEYETWDKIDNLFLNIDANKEDLWMCTDDLSSRIANVMMIQQRDQFLTFVRRPDYTWFTYNFENGKLDKRIFNIEDRDYLIRLNTDYYDQLYRTGMNAGGIFLEKMMPIEEFVKRV